MWDAVCTLADMIAAGGGVQGMVRQTRATLIPLRKVRIFTPAPPLAMPSSPRRRRVARAR